MRRRRERDRAAERAELGEDRLEHRRVGGDVDVDRGCCRRRRAASVRLELGDRAPPGPDATHRSGALTAAMLSPSGMSAAQLVLGQRHAEHRPLRRASRTAGRAAATSAQPVLHAESRRTRQAAAYSPALWPIIAAGVDAPRLEQPRPWRTRWRTAPAGRRDGASRRAVGRRRRSAVGNSAARRSRPRAASRTAAQSSIAVAVDRLVARTARRPMPAYWAPPPGIMNTTVGALAAVRAASTGRRPAPRGASAASIGRRRRPRRVAMRERLASGEAGEGDVGEVDVGVGAQVGGEVGGRAPSAASAVRADTVSSWCRPRRAGRLDAPAPPRRSRGRSCRRRRAPVMPAMRVPPAPDVPRPQLAVDEERAVREVGLRVGLPRSAGSAGSRRAAAPAPS